MPAARAPVLLVCIDGMRPDAIAQAEMPALAGLMARGAVSLGARSVVPSMTLPCHTSMPRGVDVPRHGITSNEFRPLERPVPSIFDAARAAGRRTAFFYNWAPLRDVCEAESLDLAYCWRDCKSADGDRRVARAAAAHLAEEDFDLAFVYLGFADECAHVEGWMSEPYLAALGNADRCLASILDALARRGREAATLVLADHGGHEWTHGTECPEDMTIPWILAGPGARPGPIRAPIALYDTCPTLAALLGIEPALEWEGRIVTEALA